MRRSLLCAGALAAVLLAAVRASGAAEQQPAKEAPKEPAASSTAVPGAPVVSPEASRTIEQIMKDREALITGKRFTYDPGGRRDPFRSLVEEVRRQKSLRPKGVKGMTIGEVDLVGVIHKPGGDIAFFNGS